MFTIDDIILLIIGVDILLALILFATHLRNYRAIPSRITLGFLVFAGAFLLEGIFNLYFYNSILQQAITGLTTFHLAVNLIEMVALLVLAWITWK
ncbi:MAG: hypothetical protein HY369_03475 [Candidatus Aenigmarchaeota archaeon]|nr:hypothetical protein [Candidatus Aenigmarchaeota archaeon]